MDFTREPIIETIITPKEGCKLVVRSSKSAGQEEYFVDAVEVVSFGHSLFFRSVEKPKAFLVPAGDYEILEVREARMVLKNVGLDRSIKIGGGREAAVKAPKEAPEKVEQAAAVEEPAVVPAEQPAETRVEKKRDRRRHYRRRRGREEAAQEEISEIVEVSKAEKVESNKIELPEPREVGKGIEEELSETSVVTPSLITSLLPPPPMLISETIARYKDNALFRGAFYTKEEREAEAEKEKRELEEIEEEGKVYLQEPLITPEEEFFSPQLPLEAEEEQLEQNFRERLFEESKEEEESDKEGNKNHFSNEGITP